MRDEVMSEKRNRRWWEMGLTALPAVVLLTPLIALMVVGSSGGRSGGHSAGAWATWESFEHGWPFTFLERTDYGPPSSRWFVWKGNKEWHLAGAGGDAVLFAATTAIVSALSVRRARQKLGWRLTLRECLAVMLLIGVVAAHFGWCIRRGEQAQETGRRLEAIQGSVGYEYCGPKWLIRLQWKWLDRSLEDVPLESISWVNLREIERPNMDAACKLLAEVDHPREVLMEGIEINEPLLLLMLESLTKCQPEELSLTGLKLESFMGEPWSAALLEPLARNPRLRKLNLDDTGIGDGELAALLQCRHLRRIELCSTKVTAKGLQSLLVLPQLEELAISEAATSDELRKHAAEAGVRLDVEERIWSK